MGCCQHCRHDLVESRSGYCPHCGHQLTLDANRIGTALDDTLAGDSTAGSGEEEINVARQLIGSRLSLYHIDALLGRGGMAWVFRAQHDSLQRACAVKVLCPELLRRQPQSVQRFLAEARSAASLIHPHVVTVHNIGEAGGYHFIEMEFVPGRSLQTLIEDAGRMSPLEATGYVVQAADALAAAHRQGMLHRDFKPANILVRHDGVAKLADFGLAKRVVAAHARDDQGPAGTPYFMAPELFRGQPGDKTCDVYALAVSYYLLLTGEHPYTSRDLADLARLHADQPIPDASRANPAIPPAVVALIRQSLAKEPADRPRDAGEVHSELSRVLTTLRSLQSIIDEAIGPLDASLRVTEHRWDIRVMLPRGRAQTVFIEEVEAEPWSTTVVRIYSICGPADPSYFQRALELNARVPHGSLAIQSIEGAPHFVMAHCYLRATCDPREIRHGIEQIAQWADRVEIALTGKDQY